MSDVTEGPYTCPGCDSTYYITSESYPVRDPGSISCDSCGSHITSWRGSRTWHKRVIQLQKPKKKNPKARNA